MIGGIFHLYGFILGCSIVVGWWLFEKKAQKYGITAQTSEKVIFFLLLGGVVGARLWHVLTDFPKYIHHLAGIFEVWRGGLSIIGAVVGALSIVWFLYHKNTELQKKFPLLKMLDISIFALPFAQSLGRLGNYVNHELYGLPTSLPWGVFIPLENRLPGFTSFQYFHPLFAYEAIYTLCFGIMIWWMDGKKTQLLSVGSGRLFLSYCLYYSVGRFLLDFLRIDKPVIIANMGVNQLFLAAVSIVLSFLLFRYRKGNKL